MWSIYEIGTMTIPDTHPFKIGEWLVEPELQRISRKRETRKLEYKMMEILVLLAQNAGEVVTKERLHEQVWNGVFVTDNALTRTVSKLRKALDDDPVNSEYIETISKSGYRLIASVNQAGNIQHSTFGYSAPKRKWLAALLVAILLGVFTSMNISSRDIYKGAHDPKPVSTLVGPELAHDIAPGGEKITFTHVNSENGVPDVYVRFLDDLSLVNFTDRNTPQGYGIWSPDGRYIAYASAEDEACSIFMESDMGGQKIRIGECFSRPEDFVWSPNGKTIAFTDQKPNQNRTIYFLDVENRTVKEALSPESNTSHRDPTFTVDGEYLVFRKKINGQGADIFKYHLADRNMKQLTFDNSSIFGLDVFDKDRQVIFSSNRGGQWALWRMPFAGGQPARLLINDRILLEPKVSSNDAKLIYKSVSDQTQLWRFDRKDPDMGLVSVAKSTRTDMHPALSADGKKLAFVSDRSGHFEIWIRNLETGTETKMTSFEGKFVNMPSWSPDGSEIVFDARVKGDHNVFILDVASRMIRTHVQMEGDQVNARYSLDGRTVFFASNHAGNWQVWKKSVDSEPKLVTDNGGFHLQEGYDDYLYFARMDTLGLWRRHKTEDGPDQLFLAQIGPTEWGSWITTKQGIIYLDRSNKLSVKLMSYNGQTSLILSPDKRIQLSTPTLTAIPDGSSLVFAQIEKSEDELMMVEFD